MWGRMAGLRMLELGNPGEQQAELTALVLSGAKTATAGHFVADYQAEDESLEHVGERLALVDGESRHVATLEVTGVDVMPFAAVPWEFAQAEGEGFTSLDHWRTAHHRYWTAQGYEPGPTTPIVCLYFRVLPDRASGSLT
ncbi:ASCH domain-containing protein [Nonomuraea sp. NBC_01738]|uniref:ASCH domain-containing protein n=1 Tax=Nonomuraea sp. NBC_01738 TaxID=2976003 RepID=UPI002E15B92D|nr:ASCH domain-containing protein [Nonomuraea sp. NBC_01738]